MQCPNCGQEIGIKREFCTACGKRIVVGFDQIAASVHVDAAARRGGNLERFLAWGLVGLIAIGTVIHGLNYLYDRPLSFDGADLPAIEPPPLQTQAVPELKAEYRNIFYLNLPPGQPPKVFASRFDPIKSELRSSNGGNESVAQAVDKGLGYLAGRQAADGGWQVSNQNSRISKDRDKSSDYQWARTGLSALAILAILGDGHTWLDVEKKRMTRLGAAADKGIRFLLQNQDRQNGRFGPAEGNFMYNHGLATLAMVEAAGISGDAYLRESAQMGIKLIENTQTPNIGGWKYKDEISGNPDTSVTAWQVQALLSAREIGLEVDPQKLALSLEFFKKVTEPTGMVRYDLKDRAAYSPPGVALMLRRWLGEKDTSPLRALTRKTLENVPRAEEGWGKGWSGTAKTIDQDRRARTFDPYAWYFGTYGTFFQGGEDWRQWHLGPSKQTEGVRLGLLPALLYLQDSDGAWRASDNWTSMVGEVYSTSLCIMALQAYYRIQ